MTEPQLPGPDPAALEPALTDPVVAAPPEVAAIPTDPGDVALLALVDRLAAVLDRSDLAELEVQVGGTGLVLRKPVAAPLAATAIAVPGAAPAEVGTAGPGPSTAPARPSVKAPLTGIWYGSPSPGSGPYVVEGGEVAVGQVIGLIEAMKLFNEIKSDLAGRVGKVHAENGMLVKAKQPLIEVEPL
jgi:acetyl-CoA carboxylase biotin carboxyl carrier protein